MLTHNPPHDLLKTFREWIIHVSEAVMKPLISDLQGKFCLIISNSETLNFSLSFQKINLTKLCYGSVAILTIVC